MKLSKLKFGQKLRSGADAITYGRTDAGNIVALNIASGDEVLPDALRHRSFGSAVVMAVLGFADKADGILARKAERLGIKITKEDKEKDPIEDKKFFNAIMGSLAIREFSDGNKIYAAVLLANMKATNNRDERMEESRANAVDGADTGAIRINKYKTGMQNLAHVVAVSPLTNYTVGRFIAGSIYTASTVMGEVGFRQAEVMHQTPPHLPVQEPLA